jgi:hypothetical protein
VREGAGARARGRAAGRPGGRAAGRPGGRAAGRPGGRAAGRRGGASPAGPRRRPAATAHRPEPHPHAHHPPPTRPRPGAPLREDEFELSFVYGPSASNADVHARSIAPLLRKVVEGYNATVLLFGATGSGKTTALEGGRARDPRGGGADSGGLVHLAADALFELVHSKAVAVGEAPRAAPTGVLSFRGLRCRAGPPRRPPCRTHLRAPRAPPRPAPQARRSRRGAACQAPRALSSSSRHPSWSSTMRQPTTCWCRAPPPWPRCRCGGRRGAGGAGAVPCEAARRSAARLSGLAHRRLAGRLPVPPAPHPQVVEDVDEGPVVAGLRTRCARSAEELRAVFNAGAANRDAQVGPGQLATGPPC